MAHTCRSSRRCPDRVHFCGRQPMYGRSLAIHAAPRLSHTSRSAVHGTTAAGDRGAVRPAGQDRAGGEGTRRLPAFRQPCHAARCHGVSRPPAARAQERLLRDKQEEFDRLQEELDERNRELEQLQSEWAAQRGGLATDVVLRPPGGTSRGAHRAAGQVSAPARPPAHSLVLTPRCAPHRLAQTEAENSSLLEQLDRAQSESFNLNIELQQLQGAPRPAPRGLRPPLAASRPRAQTCTAT